MLKPANEIRFFVILSVNQTLIVYVGIKYSVRDLQCDLTSIASIAISVIGNDVDQHAL